MNNDLLIKISLTSLLGIAVGLLAYVFKDQLLSSILAASLLTFLLSGSYLLVKNGTFLQCNYYRWAVLSIALLIIGVLLKIMHWPYGSLVIALALYSLWFIYAFHFWKKKMKTSVDWSKLVFISLILISRYFRIMHYPYSEELLYGAFLTLLYPVLIFIYRRQPTDQTDTRDHS